MYVPAIADVHLLIGAGVRVRGRSLEKGPG